MSEQEKEVANTFKIDKYCQRMASLMAKFEENYNPDLSPVVNSVIHGVTAKYPQALYTPGYTMMLKVAGSLPTRVFDYVTFQQANDLKKILEL